MPTRGARHRFRVGGWECLPHNGIEIFGDGAHRGDPFGGIRVARFGEHRPEQSRSRECELHVCDGNVGEVVGRLRGGMRGGQRCGQLSVAHGRDGGQQGIAVGEVTVSTASKGVVSLTISLKLSVPELSTEALGR